MKVLAFCFILCSSLFAGETFKADSVEIAGVKYEGAAITLKNAIEANIMHSTGTKRIPASELPAEIQVLIGYQPARAAEASAALSAQQAQQAKAADLQARIAKLPLTILEVWQNTQEGLIAEKMKESQNITYLGTSMSRVGGGGNAIAINGPVQIINTGDYVFIPHTAATRSLATQSRFKARIEPTNNTRRINAGDVYPVFKMLHLEPMKTATP